MNDDVDCVIDSGASSHIINNPSLFTFFRPTFDRFVRVANGSKLKVTGIGTVGKLKDVLCVPDIRLNLISVPQLDKAGHRITFTRGQVFLDNTLIGTLSDRLYRSSMVTIVKDDIAMLAMDINNSTVSFLKSDHEWVNQSIPRDIELLHRRFGHADVSMIKRMITYGSATGLSVSQTAANPNSFHCEACALSKAFQRKRIKNKRKVDGPLHSNRNLYFVAVYSDVLGPILPAAVGGYEYGVTFTEAETRYRFFYPLKKKSDVLTVFKQLVSELSAQGFTVRGLKTDNGGEYCSDEFAQFTTLHNIIHRKTPPNTPQANSLSERYNRVLGERARAMLSVTPKYLWAESMKTTTYVYNRSLSPSDPTATRTPFELLFGIVPDVSNLRVFGCVAYMFNFDTSKSKLDDRAVKGTFVGYDSTSSAYLIYIHETKTVRRFGHVF